MSQNARRWIRHLLVGATLLGIPLGAAAQGVYADQVWSRLDEMQDAVESGGYSYEGESSGWMMAGAQGAAVVRLPAGSYVAFGACDDDCSDIDLLVSLMSSRETLAADEEMDAIPVVEFTLSEEADVMLGISMPGCATARCYVGFRWFAGDTDGGGMGDGDPAMGMGGWEDQVMVQLDALDVPEDAVVHEEKTGIVNAGEEERWTYDLPAGYYQAWAVCDFDCSDIDLAVFDAGGTLVGSDVLDDDVPVVDFQVRKGGGAHYFAVQMVECTTGGCGYGFRLFKMTNPR